jgi:hypothetical protein
VEPYRARFTLGAKGDLLWFYGFLAQYDVTAAERALDAINAPIELLRF